MSDGFEAYQAERQKVENDTREAISSWAINCGPPNMTVEQIKELQRRMVFVLNGSSRRFWDMGRETPHEN